jgi:hypothetical protein
MPKTYEPIATQTLGTASATVTFTSIPQTYTDLVLVISGTTSVTGASIFMRFNSDTSSLYSDTHFSGGSGSVATARDTNSGNGLRVGSSVVGATANVQQNSIHNIQNYTNTSVFKTVLSRFNTDTEVMASIGLYRSTNAITTINLYNGASANFGIDTMFTLYGIKAA